MPRLPSTLLALALASAFAAPLWAQQVTTSHGVRTLTRTDGFKSEAQYLQAARVDENVLLELMQDIATVEGARSTANADAAGLPEKVKKANAENDAAQAAYDRRSKQYREDVAAFEQRQAQLAADLQRQRAEAAVHAAKAEVDRDYAQTTRLNDWATRLTQQQTQVDNDRVRLMADHAAIEAERTKLSKSREDAENRLKGMRDTTVGQINTSSAKRVAAYHDLRVTVNHLRQVRVGQAKASGKTPSRSDILDRASDLLSKYDAAQPSARR